MSSPSSTSSSEVRALRRFVLRIATFLACVAAIYVLTLLLAANGLVPQRVMVRTNMTLPVVGSVETPTFRALDSIETPLDILFLGSSHAQLAFDPRVFDSVGLRTFTLATPAQAPVNSYYLLERYAPRVQPRVLVFEVWWEALATDGTQAAARLAMALPLSPSVFRMLLAVPTLKAWNVAAMRLLDLSGRLPERRTTNPNLATHQGRGFFVIPSGVSGNRRYRPRTITMLPRQLDYTRRIVRLMRARGTTVLLVVAPVPEGTTGNIENLAAIGRALETLAQEEGARYVDFTRLIQLDPIKSFHDSGHLTEAGSRDFLKVFLRELGPDLDAGRGRTPSN